MADDDLTIPIDDDAPVHQDEDSIPLLEGEEEEAEEETISLNDPMRGTTSNMRRIRSSLEAGRKTDYKRPMNISGHGATRCRLFHCKIAEASLNHLETVVNDWIDDEGIDVKHVGHMVGPMEGKHTEQNVIIIVWY